MHDGRLRLEQAAGGAAFISLLLLTACGVPLAAPVSSMPSPSSTETSSLPPQASADVSCESAVAEVVPRSTVLPGTPITVRLADFPANAIVTFTFSPLQEGDPRPFGSTTTDAQGAGVFATRVPPDAAYGEVDLLAVVGERCATQAYLHIVGSLEGIEIDDDSVEPGQSVTITASGFLPRESVGIVLDGDAFDALSQGRALGGAEADDLGHVTVVVRIPTAVSAGAHFLTANGYSFDGTHDVMLRVDITVEG